MVFRESDFTKEAQAVLHLSQELMWKYKHTQWDPEHILLALLEHEKGVPMLIFEELHTAVKSLRNRLVSAMDPKLFLATGFITYQIFHEIGIYSSRILSKYYGLFIYKNIYNFKY